MPQHDAKARRRASGPGPAGADSFKARFVALRTLRPFMVMVWKTSPSLTFFSLMLRLTRALLPVATLYVGKLIIDDVVRLAQMPDHPTTLSAWLASGRFDRMTVLIIVEFALAILADMIGRVVMLVDSLLSDRLTNEFERQPDGTRANARPRGFRGRRVPGPARAGAAADHRTRDA